MNVRPVLGVVLLAVLARTAAAAPRDFTPEARAVYAVAACGEPAGGGYDRRVIADHCREVAGTVAQWKRNWLDKASPFLAKLVGKAPATVVYPFGGGDVVTMLAVFPDATDYTSLSLEGMGDPRPLARLAGGKQADKLADNLARLRRALVSNLGWAWNMTIDLSRESSDTGLGIPNLLAIAMVALHAHGYEPLEVRYFELAPDGSLVYVTEAALAEWDADRARPLAGKRKHHHALQQGLFNNIEVVFRKRGDAAAPRKTFRHIAADLSDAGLARHGGALAYVDGKRDLAAMTKAASYLFWKPAFERIRKVFLARMQLMVSDDTGIPPRFAKPAGFKQDVYGTFKGTFFKWADQEIAKEMIALWETAAEKTLPFKFGYYDNRRNAHLLYTYR